MDWRIVGHRLQKFLKTVMAVHAGVILNSLLISHNESWRWALVVYVLAASLERMIDDD